MIKNEHQYKVVRNEASSMETILESIVDSVEFSKLDERLQKAHVGALRQQLVQLRADLEAYETLKSGKFDFQTLCAFDQLPTLLIQARIARGLLQQDLARKLKLKPQQIQLYEASNYESASLARMRSIADLLLSPASEPGISIAGGNRRTSGTGKAMKASTKRSKGVGQKAKLRSRSGK